MIQLRGRLIEQAPWVDTAGAGRYSATADADPGRIVVCDDLDDAIRLRRVHADAIVVMWDRSGRALSSDVARGLDARLDAYVTGAEPELLIAHLDAARRHVI